MTPTPVYLDNTILKAIATCSTRALMQYAYGLRSREARTPLTAGIAFHEALAHYLIHSEPVAAVQVFEQTYRPYAEEQHITSADRYSWQNCAAILAEWIVRNPPHVLNAAFRIDPTLVEVGFMWPLLDGDTCGCGAPLDAAVHQSGGCQPWAPIFVGRMDAIVHDHTQGGLYVLDHKTTGRLDSRFLRSFTNDSQLSGYVFAAQQHTQQPVHGAIINAIEVKKIPDSARRCATHGVAYAECGPTHLEMVRTGLNRTAEQLATWRTTTLMLFRRWRLLTHQHPDLTHITQVHTEGVFNAGCQWCDFTEWCSIGRPQHLVPTMFEHELWNPAAFAQEAAA